MHRITGIDHKCTTGTPVTQKIGAKSHKMGKNMPDFERL